MDICKDIENAKRLSGNLSYAYSKKAIFGNEKKEDLITLLRLNCYIRTLERNIPEKRKVKVPVLGHTVKFCSLKRRNNMLFLDNEHFMCSEVESRPCLSDEEICKILESIQLICISNN